MQENERLHIGHRQRMKKKLAIHEHTIFATYELLEMLLYYVIPYKDTKPVAKTLLSTFGTLDGVLSATPAELCSVKGIGERAGGFISLVGSLSSMCYNPLYATGASNTGRYEAVGEILVELFGGKEELVTYAIFLDNSMRPVAIEKIGDCDLASGAVTAKAFIEPAIKHGASAVITAHNHPFGPLYLTPSDIVAHAFLERELGLAGIVIAEHYIICGDSYIGTKDNISAGAEKLPALKHFSPAGRGIRTALGKVLKSSETLPRGAEELASLFSTFTSAEEATEAIERLFTEYTSLSALFSAPRQMLTASLDGKPHIPLFIKLFSGIASRRMTDKVSVGDTLSPEALSDYLRGLFFGRGAETMYLIGFDSGARFLGAECLGEGTVNSFSLNSRKVLEVAGALGAKSVILAHNHPLGVNEASDEDVMTTVKIERLLTTVGIRLGAHYIVTENGVSMIDAFSEM